MHAKNGLLVLSGYRLLGIEFLLFGLYLIMEGVREEALSYSTLSEINKANQ